MLRAGAGRQTFKRLSGVGAALDLIFTNNSLDSRISYTGQNGTYFDSTGTLKTAAFNLLTYSEQFDNVVWAQTSATVVANSVVSPNGTQTADTFVASNGVSSNHVLGQNYTFTAGVHTFSLYAKKALTDFVQLRYGASAIASGTGYANFDLNTGTVGTIGAGLSGATITSVGDGWYRCTVTGTTAAAASAAGVYLVSSATSSSAEVWTTTGASVYLWGAQLETGSTATTYIPTTSAGNGAPRFDYDPTQYYPNLFSYPEAFDNTSWNKYSSLTATADQAVAPNGLMTADRITSPNTGSYIGRAASFVNGTQYTISVFIKDEVNASSAFSILLYGSSWNSGGTNVSIQYNLQTGTGSVPGGNVAPTGYSITPVGNGWYRCSITQTFTAATASIEPFQFRMNAIGSLLIWGAKLEVGSVATPYDNMGLVTQNLFTYSNDYSNAVWSKARASVGNFVTAPDGTNTAVEMVEDTSSGQAHFFTQVLSTLQDNNTVTFKATVKAAGRDRVYIQGRTKSNAFPTCMVNLTNGTVSTVSSCTPVVVSLGNGWYDIWISHDLVSGVSTPQFYIIPADAAGSQNYTGDGRVALYVWRSQLNYGNSPLPYTATTSATVTQCAPRGLLIEESRTNSIRNNTMAGAVAGSSGTIPTNWFASAPTGLTRTIALNTVNGISCIDIRYAGTTTGAGQITILFEGNSTAAAASGQTWASSVYLQLVSGSLPTSLFQIIAENNSGGTFLTSTSTEATPGASLARVSTTRTLNNASTAFVNAYLQTTSVGSGVAVDFTLRIGMPQLELGAFASSVIATSLTAVTRAADLPVVSSIGSWFNATEGTIVASAVTYADGSASRTFVHLDDGTTNNRIMLNRSISTKLAFLTVAIGGVGQADMSSGSLINDGTLLTMASSYKQNDFAISGNGATVTTDTLGDVPTVTTLRLGHRPGATVHLNGWLKRVTYYPVKAANTTIQVQSNA